jgi:transcriptional regulator NrdR family protein
MYGGAWAVRSASGTLQPFSRDKLLMSLYASCQHRKTALDDASALTDTVIKKLLSSTRDGTINSQIITDTALVALSRFDKAASTHYAAFHAGD